MITFKGFGGKIKENKVILWIGGKIKWLYEKAKKYLKLAYDWLSANLPMLKPYFRRGYCFLLFIIKGSLFGFYYGLKDGYHFYKKKFKNETDYFFLTSIQFEKEGEEN